MRRYALILTLIATHTVSADAPSTFLKTYCIRCHSGDDPKGERDFSKLDFSKSDLSTQIKVQEIIDQLTLGSMPPKRRTQPTTKKKLQILKDLRARLLVMRQKSKSTGGQTVLRRLSKREYRNTVHDLLGIDLTMFDPTLEFPGDTMPGHFDNIGSALTMSGHLLERYLHGADACVEKAFAITEKPKVQTWNFEDRFYQQAELARGHRDAFNNRYLCLYDHPYNDKTEGGYGPLAQFKTGVPVEGVYEIRVFAKAMHRDTPYSRRSVRLDLDEPFRLGIRPGNTAIKDMVHRQPIQPKLAETVIADDSFKWCTFRIHLDKGFAPRFTFENGHHDFRGMIGRLYRFDRAKLPRQIRNAQGIFLRRIALIKHAKLPHIRIDKVQIRGPIEGTWPTRSRQLLLNGATVDDSTASGLIKQFASRAFRRAATKKEVERFVTFYRARRNAKIPSESAFKDTLKAILCSPGFLYFKHPIQGNDKKSRLSQHALAERLSYFLTSTMPDDRLRQLADRGELSNEKTLRAEVKRLLKSKASHAFVADFLESWLNLRSLGSMPPDTRNFWFYYAGELEVDMKTETRMFFRDILDRNASLVEMLSANHSFVNRDLAKLYRIQEQVPAKDATRFRRVTFRDKRRGGLLGQASVLTVSANGIETSPVVRGVWILENILGTPTPPPPDDVPALEPDTRGVKTIRDQLAKHRENKTCAQCHRRIDPPGFALEHFDAIGQRRQFYDKRRRQRIDSSGEMPSGERFTGLPQFKSILIKRKDFFARTVTERLITHALGRAIEPTDRKEIDQILSGLKKEKYPLASLIESIVLSDLFTR